MKSNFKKIVSILMCINITIFSNQINIKAENSNSFKSKNNISNIDSIESEPIDAVIKYIDLNDKKLVRKGIPQIKKDFDNEELRYSLRSILKNIPWIRKIFIIMPNEKVRFLKEKDYISDKIVYVKDKDLLGYDSASISTFQFNLWKIRDFGCSNNFIYFDDDYFVGKPLKKSDFFYEENGKVIPYIIYNKNIGYGQKERINSYWKEQKRNIDKSIKNAHTHSGFQYQKISGIMFLYKFFNKDILAPSNDLVYFPHNALGENIDELKEIYDIVKNNYEYSDSCISALTRSNESFVHQTFYNFYYLNKYGRKVNKLRGDYIDLSQADYVDRNAPLFCINTGGNIEYTPLDNAKAKIAMHKLFPIATKYEKQDIDDGEYTIESALDKNKVLDINGASKEDCANLQLWEKNGTSAQKFKISYNSEGWYTITSVCSGKNLDVESSGKSEGTNIQQYSANDSNAQKWYLIPAENDLFYIVSACNNCLVDISGANTSNGTNVHCWCINNTNAQKFRFTK